MLIVVWRSTAIGAVVGMLAPGLASGPGPHPVLHGTLADAAGILVANLRLLAVPFILALAGFGHKRASRVVGDLIVVAIVAVNTLRVGLALGRYALALVSYIPQLPLEWLALALATTAWTTARHQPQPQPRRAVARLAAQTVLTAAAAALIEAFATPHVR